MTVLVLDSPELIARAAAMEAAQASKQVQAEETGDVHADAEASASGQMACTTGKNSRCEQPQETLALVI
ncbi:hypothetical protein [Marinobacter zhanjiangensis]|uniref:Uncharacterized protein n=1 Tax=Marinobacter zhanjiangensis TaxID=578215 RepID=A0ABQ3AJA9_9GAMM|nr:hypothetical protein [Marinobacter zhanjiangensis]GGY58732.1 hypothetical protein GCM10007071_01090 [Marinobacter zhanjiangensis]